MKLKWRSAPTRRQIQKAIGVLRDAPFEEIQQLGYHFQVNDFYSPLNDIAFLRQNEDLWKTPTIPLAINWNKDRQIEIARKVSLYVEELIDIPNIPQRNPVSFGWQNDMWNNADALVQYGFIREFKPGKVVEIGCGWSSLLLEKALQANKVDTKVTLVEPFPNQEIFSVLPAEWQHHRCILQRANIEIFESLEAGDFCFYDGSHCVKAGSDVAWFFFEILPKLASGVIIHIHDIFLPESYPETWIYDRGQTWNEQELLRAFLMHNDSYEILIANRFLWREEPILLESLYKNVQPAYGCSFWFQKR